VSDEQHVALPHLYGGPAYSRPPRPVAEIPRPFDPDELPLEAERSDEDAARAAQLIGGSWAPAILPATKVKGPRKPRAAKAGKAGAAGGAAAGAAKSVGAGSAGPSHGNGSGNGGLQGRPLRLRGLGRIFGAGRK
jgi:hypothetical protein